MYKYETHMHSYPVSACADVSAKSQVMAYKKRGYTGIILTDHFLNGYTSCPRHGTWESRIGCFLAGYNKAKAAGDSCGLDVFLGWEYSCFDGTDFLTYGLDADFLYSNPKMDKLDIEEYSKLIRGNGGYLAQAHPYRRDYWVSNKAPVDPKLIDGVEVYNATMRHEINRLALDFAKRFDLAPQAGSDCHYSTPDFPSGIILSEKAKTVHDIIKALKAKTALLLTPNDFKL